MLPLINIIAFSSAFLLSCVFLYSIKILETKKEKRNYTINVELISVTTFIVAAIIAAIEIFEQTTGIITYYIPKGLNTIISPLELLGFFIIGFYTAILLQYIFTKKQKTLEEFNVGKFAYKISTLKDGPRVTSIHFGLATKHEIFYIIKSIAIHVITMMKNNPQKRKGRIPILSKNEREILFEKLGEHTLKQIEKLENHEFDELEILSPLMYGRHGRNFRAVALHYIDKKSHAIKITETEKPLTKINSRFAHIRYGWKKNEHKSKKIIMSGGYIISRAN